MGFLPVRSCRLKRSSSGGDGIGLVRPNPEALLESGMNSAATEVAERMVANERRQMNLRIVPGAVSVDVRGVDFGSASILPTHTGREGSR